MSSRLRYVWIAALWLPAALPLALQGCQPVKPSPPPTITTTGCAAFSKMVLTEAEAAAAPLSLIEKIRAHNLAYTALCTKK